MKVYSKEDLILKPNVKGAKMWAIGMEQTMMTYFELEPNTIFPKHKHIAEQITYILEGELIFQYDGQEVTLKAGEAIAIPSSAEHGAYTTGKFCKAVDAWSPVREEFLT